MKKASSLLVETVIPLTAGQTSALKALLKKSFGTEMFSTSLNPKLLGGVRVTAGSTQFDATLAGKLAQLRKS